MARACDLTQGGLLCPAKALLADQDDSREAFDLYSRYFDKFLFVDDSICVPSLRASQSGPGGQKMLKDLYRWNSAKEEPAFFSFSNRHDLTRLSLLTDREIVVYYYDPRSSCLVIVQDARGVSLDALSRPVNHYLLVSDGRLLRDEGPEDTSALDEAYLANPANAYFSRDFLVPDCETPNWLQVTENLLRRFEHLGEISAPLPDDPISQPADFQGCRASLWERWTKPVVLCSFVGLSGKPPVSYQLGRALRSRKSLSAFQTLTFVRPESGSVSDLLSRPTSRVLYVCFFAGRAVGLLTDAFAEVVRQNLLGLSEEKERLSNGGYGSCLPPPGLGPKLATADREAAYKLLRQKRQTARAAKIDDTVKRCRCATCCSRDFDFNMSRAGPERLMAGRYCSRDLVKMLGMDSLLVRAGEADLLEEASNLCVASMDIESRTVEVDVGRSRSDREGFSGLRRPEEVREVQRPIMLAHVDQLTVAQESSDPSRFSFTVTDDSDEAVYEMFRAYWDYVCFARKRAAVVKACLLKPLYEAVFAYKKAYFDFCVEWQLDDDERRSQKIKEAAAGPPRKRNKPVREEVPVSLDELAEMNRRDLKAPLDSFLLDKDNASAAVAAADFSDSEEEEEEEEEEQEEEEEEESEADANEEEREMREILKEAGMRVIHGEWPEVFGNADKKTSSFDDLTTRAWRHTLPGKLEESLNTMVRSYTVFSFYGSGYDNVLLLAYLVPRLFELGFRPRVERRGNRITSISTRCGVSFRDVTKLLAPSMNLRKFGQLFGLQQKKAHFPFALLTGVEALRLPCLPPSAEDPVWQSNLSFKKTTQEEVDEALQLFAEACCQNVGDYLAAYLRLDVEILHKATVAWKRQLYQVVGLDFVDARRFTISSLSYDAGLRVWEAKRRIGCFFPNNSQHYRLLRRGMRG